MISLPFPSAVISLLRDLSALPYENLSKIAAFHREGASAGAGEKSLLLAAGWLDKSRESGVGGTCFSLTWWLERRMRAQGLDAAFLMGDKGTLKNIHCALRFDWEGRAYLLDPGYMIFEPLPLPEAGLSASAWISPNELRLDHLSERDAWRLWSGPRGELKYRFDFRRQAVGKEEFLAHWEASYAFPMMGYPVINRMRDGNQYYLQKRSLLVRTPEGGTLRKLSEAEMREALTVTFRLPEPLVREGMEAVMSLDRDFFRK